MAFLFLVKSDTLGLVLEMFTLNRKENIILLPENKGSLNIDAYMVDTDLGPT